MVDNYLFCEPLIIDKLRADIPELVSVDGAAGLSNLDRENPTCPCVYVIYAGDVQAPAQRQQAAYSDKHNLLRSYGALHCVFTCRTAAGLVMGSAVKLGRLLPRYLIRYVGLYLTKSVADL